MSDAKPRRKVTFKTLQKKMAAGEPITQLAAYDYRTAVIADRLGMDILCVSDTGGMILFGHQSTTAVSFDEDTFSFYPCHLLQIFNMKYFPMTFKSSISI